MSGRKHLPVYGVSGVRRARNNGWQSKNCAASDRRRPRRFRTSSLVSLRDADTATPTTMRIIVAMMMMRVKTVFMVMKNDKIYSEATPNGHL